MQSPSYLIPDAVMLALAKMVGIDVAKSRRESIRVSTITAEVATAKTRYILDHGEADYDSIKDEPGRLEAISPYLGESLKADIHGDVTLHIGSSAEAPTARR